MEANANPNAGQGAGGTEATVSLDAIIEAPGIVAGMGSQTPNPDTNTNQNQNQNPDNSGQGGGDNQSANAGNPDNTLDTSTFEGMIAALSQETVDVSLKDIKDNLLSTFKATKLDAQGNLINDANEVILSNAKLREFLVDDKYPTDDKGNVVNDKGEIVITKEDLIKSKSVILPIKERLETDFNFKFPDNLDLKEDESSLTVLVNEAVKALNRNSVINFLNSAPELRNYYEHLALGGTPETYKSTAVDYKSVDVKTLTREAKLDLLNKSFSLQGTPSKDKVIELLEKEGEETFNSSVADALKYLDNKQEEANQQRRDLLAKQEADRLKEVQDYWNGVEGIVTKGSLGVIDIPLTEREAFFNYMAKPIDENMNSQEALDSEKDTMEFQLLVSYLRYKKGDVSQLVKILKQQEHVNDLRAKFKGLDKLTGNGVLRTGNTNQGGGANVSLDAVLPQ